MCDYIAKQPTATDITADITKIKDKFTRQYGGQLLLDVPGAVYKIEATEEIFSQLFNEINTIYQS